MQDSHVNVEHQRALYGEPLADTAARVMGALGLTQARLAQVLQISAPMMSQLISAQRVKIGNPAVVHRLQSLSELAGQAAGMTADEVTERLETIRDEQATMTGLTVPVARASTAAAELRAVAAPQELRALADATTNVALAALLRSAADRD